MISTIRAGLSLRPVEDGTAEGRSRERYRRIFLTSGSALFARLVTSAAALLTVPLTVSYLGPERYGLWMTISSLIALLGFADFGMGNGLLTAISAAHGRDDQQGARRVVSSAFFMLSAVAVLLLLLFALVNPWVDWARAFNVTSPVAMREAGPTAAVLVLFLCLNMPLGTVQRVQQGYQEGFASNLWSAVGSIFALGGLLIVTRAKGGLPWLALAMAGGPTIALLFNWASVFGASRRSLFPRRTHFDLGTARQLAGAGSLFFILSLLAIVASSSDNLVIAHVVGPAAVAKYAVTQKLFISLALSHYFITPLWPAFGEAIAKGDYSWARRTLRRAIELSLWVGLLTSIPLIILAQPFVRWWVGAGLEPSLTLLIGFSAWLLLSGYGGVMSTFLNNGALLRKQLRLYATAAITAIVLKILLAYTWGIEGVIIGTVVGWAVVYVVPSARMAFGFLRAHPSSEASAPDVDEQNGLPSMPAVADHSAFRGGSNK